ncbi:MAG: hypothetical protein AAGI09_15435, partial [Pseudomonadota bacterium]
IVMATFLLVLTSYYMCDLAASETLLSRDDAIFCASLYVEVKSHFGDGETGAAAYLAFKTWEAENAATVLELRADAAQRLRKTTSY